MKPVNLKTLAAIGAVALGVSLSSGAVWAAAYELDSGDTFNVTVTADVMQTVQIDVLQNVDFGQIGIHQDGVDTATITMDPDGTVSEDVVGPARIVIDDNDTPLAATVDLTAAFPDTDIHVTYTHVADLNCAACLSGPPDLALDDVADSMVAAAALTLGTGVQQGSFAQEGIGTTTALGELSWEIGATISTIAGALPYETGTYVGSFDMELSY
jgi:hypothetical protein